MTKSAESVVRELMAAWQRWQPDELAAFLTDSAVWTDGHNEPCVGIDAIKTRLEAIGRLIPGPAVEVKNLLASGGTVMVERIDVIQVKDESFRVEVAGVFDVDSSGRVVRWRDYYDSRALEDSVVALLRAPE